jgi:hypothetical protein
LATKGRLKARDLAVGTMVIDWYMKGPNLGDVVRNDFPDDDELIEIRNHGGMVYTANVNQVARFDDVAKTARFVIRG